MAGKISELPANPAPDTSQEVEVRDGIHNYRTPLGDLPINTAMQVALDAKARAADLSSHESEPHPTAAHLTKLDAIEPGATTDQSGGEIKSAYEAEANTNAYTDSEKAKLAAIDATHYGMPLQSTTALAALPESSLTDKERHYVEDELSDYFYDVTASSGEIAPTDQTGGTGFWRKVAANGETTASIKTKYESNANTNAFTDAEQTKLGNLSESHQSATNNPHSVTTSHLGLGNVDNTSDADKPISTAVASALAAKASVTVETQLSQLETDLSDHEANTSNPHGVTASHLGLGNVENTSDADKPISTTVASALAAKASVTVETQLSQLETDLSDHEANTSNPHGVTASHLGLGNVENTSDADKPISTTVASALAAKASVTVETQLSQLETDLSDHEANTSNPHGVTKTQVGLGNADNTSDADKPVSAAQQSAIDAVSTSVSNHTSSQSNPHNVTKTQVGLGNVDNTPDASKPISIATQSSLNALIGNYIARQVLTDGITIPYNVTNGVNARVTLGGNRALEVLTNANDGQAGSLIITQDGTGNRSLTLDSSYKVVSGDPAEIASQGANKRSILSWERDDGDTLVWITHES